MAEKIVSGKIGGKNRRLKCATVRHCAAASSGKRNISHENRENSGNSEMKNRIARTNDREEKSKDKIIITCLKYREINIWRMQWKGGW
jgi:hypothetical protein